MATERGSITQDTSRDDTIAFVNDMYAQVQTMANTLHNITQVAATKQELAQCRDGLESVRQGIQLDLNAMKLLTSNIHGTEHDGGHGGHGGLQTKGAEYFKPQMWPS